MPFSTMVGLPSSRKLSSSGPPGSPPRRSAFSMKLTFFSFNPQSRALSSSESDSRRSSSSSSSSGTPQPPFRHFFSPRDPSGGTGGRRRGASRRRTAWASWRRLQRLRSPRRSRRYRWGCDTSLTFCRNWRVMSSVASICAGTRGARCHPGRQGTTTTAPGEGGVCVPASPSPAPRRGPCSSPWPCWRSGTPELGFSPQHTHTHSCDPPQSVTTDGMGPQRCWSHVCHRQPEQSRGWGRPCPSRGQWGSRGGVQGVGCGGMPGPPLPAPTLDTPSLQQKPRRPLKKMKERWRWRRMKGRRASLS